MDLAIGAKDVFVLMTLLTREGASKIVEACTYPLTGVGCVTRVYTDTAVFLTGPDGVTVRETFGSTLAELQKLVPVGPPGIHRHACQNGEALMDSSVDFVISDNTVVVGTWTSTSGRYCCAA
jgi:hypothetical protein